MKVVCISDTHSSLVPVPDGDILIHAGDITGWGRLDELHLIRKWFASRPHKHKILIAGNHDACFESMHDESKEILGDSCTYLENSSVEIEGLKIYGSPYQPRFFDWSFNIDRDSEAIAACWDLIPDDTDILVTHGPPKGILDKNIHGEECGCERLLPRVMEVKPKHHIFGHIHQSHGELVQGGIHFVNASVLDDHYDKVFEPIAFEIK